MKFRFTFYLSDTRPGKEFGFSLFSVWITAGNRWEALRMVSDSVSDCVMPYHVLRRVEVDSMEDRRNMGAIDIDGY